MLAGGEKINNKLFPFELFVVYELFRCSSCDFIIAIKSISCQRIAIGCHPSWVWSCKLRFTSCRAWFSLSSFRPWRSHTLRAGTTQCRCITRSSRWQQSVRLPCPIYSRVNIPSVSVRPYRIRRLRSNVSKPPGENFRLVLRVLPTLHPPLVYYGYVFHMNLASLFASFSRWKSHYECWCHRQFQNRNFDFHFLRLSGVGYLVMIIGFLIKWVYVVGLASVVDFNGVRLNRVNFMFAGDSEVKESSVSNTTSH